MEKQGWNQSRNKESAEEMERLRVAFNLRRMRTSYTMEDLLEERSRGVSTELSLSHYDPFTIKKKMKPSDLGNLCRLLVPSDLVEKHILPFLNTAQANQVAGVVSRQETNRGLKDFVKRRNLAEGDEIGIYWDKDQCRFTFSVLSRACLVR
ncbi:hypothetical protein OIU76_029770 [Salix suchowensis]|nr:hypothetical protein OIU76_029770 [Salix suchowensis]